MTSRSTTKNTVSVCAARSYWPVVGHTLALNQRNNNSTRDSRPITANSSLYRFSSFIGSDAVLLLFKRLFNSDQMIALAMAPKPMFFIGAMMWYCWKPTTVWRFSGSIDLSR